MALNNEEVSNKLFATFALSSKKKNNITEEVSNPRNYTLLKFNEILKNASKSKNLEISIFNWTIKYIKNNKIEPQVIKRGKVNTINNNTLSWTNNRFKRMYLSKYRSILFNLKNKNNPIFLENVMKNIIPTHQIVNMKPEEIYPELWENIFQNEIKKNVLRLKNEGKELEQAVEGQYTCGKCKCKKISYYELQTRSADEPMTAFFTCLNCKNHWKE